MAHPVSSGVLTCGHISARQAKQVSLRKIVVFIEKEDVIQQTAPAEPYVCKVVSSRSIPLKRDTLFEALIHSYQLIINTGHSVYTEQALRSAVSSSLVVSINTRLRFSLFTELASHKKIAYCNQRFVTKKRCSHKSPGGRVQV